MRKTPIARKSKVPRTAQMALEKLSPFELKDSLIALAPHPGTVRAAARSQR